MDLDRAYTSIHAFLNHWEGVRMVTGELLLCFQDAELGYRLVPEWRTVGELFHHIGGQQYFVSRGVLLRRWQPVPGEPDMDWAQHQDRSGPALCHRPAPGEGPALRLRRGMSIVLGVAQG